MAEPDSQLCTEVAETFASSEHSGDAQVAQEIEISNAGNSTSNAGGGAGGGNVAVEIDGNGGTCPIWVQLGFKIKGSFDQLRKKRV